MRKCRHFSARSPALWLLAVVGGCGPAPLSSGSGGGEAVEASTGGGEGSTTARDEPVPIPIPDMGAESPPSSFITMSDGGGGVSFECDVFEQNCDPGFKCSAWANDGGPHWNATKCVPLDPDPDHAGEPCTVEGVGLSGIDSCALGALCWEIDDEGVGVCQDFCQGSAEAPVCDDPETQCGGPRDFPMCLPSCCPVEQDCHEGQGCYPASDNFLCAPDASGDAGGFGDPCAFINACAPGLLCIGADVVTDCVGAVGCCSPVCTIGSPVCSDLNPGMDCEAWFAEGQAPAGLEHVGVCAVPL
jgi:hypothetical protein